MVERKLDLGVVATQLPGTRCYSETIDAEMSRFLEEATARVTVSLTAKRATREALAMLLLEKQVLIAARSTSCSMNRVPEKGGFRTGVWMSWQP